MPLGMKLCAVSSQVRQAYAQKRSDKSQASAPHRRFRILRSLKTAYTYQGLRRSASSRHAPLDA